MADELNRNKDCRIGDADGGFGDYTLIRFGTTQDLVVEPNTTTVVSTQPAKFPFPNFRNDPIFQAPRSRAKVTGFGKPAVHSARPQQREPPAQMDMSRVHCYCSGFPPHYAEECYSLGLSDPPKRHKVGDQSDRKG